MYKSSTKNTNCMTKLTIGNANCSFITKTAEVFLGKKRNKFKLLKKYFDIFCQQDLVQNKKFFSAKDCDIKINFLCCHNCHGTTKILSCYTVAFSPSLASDQLLHRIKILLLTFKCLYGLTPNYFIELISTKKQSRYSLRSNKPLLIELPSTKTHPTLGDHAFQSAAPYLQNALPLTIHNIKTLDTCKTAVKLIFLIQPSNNFLHFQLPLTKFYFDNIVKCN